MLIVSRVCAEFRNRAGKTIFAIRPQNLNSFLEAPEEIREDPLFSLMMSDGSMEAAHTVEEKRKLESDPLEGVTPEGKKPSRKPTKTKANSTATTTAEAAPDAADQEKQKEEKFV